MLRNNADAHISSLGYLCGYISHYTMLFKFGNGCTRLLKIKNKLKIVGFYK